MAKKPKLTREQLDRKIHATQSLYRLKPGGRPFAKQVADYKHEEKKLEEAKFIRVKRASPMRGGVVQTNGSVIKGGKSKKGFTAKKVVYPEITSRAFYLHEEQTSPVETERQNGKVRVLTVVDLFAGAGGFTLGFVEAGLVPVFAVEFDKAAAETYEANFGPHCLSTDINNVDVFPKADVIIGGPPCQGFSNLGAHIPNDPRNQLWRHYVRAVEQVKPLVFVVENVPPLLSSEEGQELIRQTRKLGYEVEGRILNSADYGAAQIRKRTIIIGSRVGPVSFPEQTNVNPKKRDLTTHHLADWITVRQVIGDLPFEPTGHSLHTGRNPTPKSILRYKHIPPGGNRWNLPRHLMPECWKRKLKGGTDLFGRLHWNQPSVTIRTEFFKPEKGRYLHPEANRPITHREAARIQGFPDDFDFKGSKIAIAKQIGNAVPVKLAYAVAQAVKKMIKAEKE
jgi:DNA (cytosine-5)-methyltransferase 1